MHMRDIIFGIDGVIKEIGLSKKRVIYFMREHKMPVNKVGGNWAASRELLNEWKIKNRHLFLIERLKKLDELIAGYRLSFLEDWKMRESDYYKELDMPSEINENAISRAQKLLQKSVKKKMIKKSQSCQICGRNRKIIGHHENYDKPLEVIWVCQSCHRKIHLEINIRNYLDRRVKKSPCTPQGREGGIS